MHDDDHHHHHHHDHSHGHVHGPGHNHAHEADHLHSHVGGDAARERAQEAQVLAAAFLDGFRAAEDKTSFLRLAGVPFKIDGEDGLAMHLVEAGISSSWQLGTASPAFGSRELVYLAYPKEMIGERETMTFTYVSLTERLDVDLMEVISMKMDADR